MNNDGWVDDTTLNNDGWTDDGPAESGSLQSQGSGLSLIQGQEPSFSEKSFDRMFAYFKDPEKEKEKAVQALVDSEALGISPSSAYRYRDQIDQGIKLNPMAVNASKRTTLTDRVKQSFDTGIKQNQIGEIGYKYILTGDPKHLDAMNGITIDDDFISESRLESAVRSAAKFLPMMYETGKESVYKGLGLGVVAGGTAALMGGEGPQGVVTIPAATALGFTVGATSGAFEGSLRKEAGLALSDIIKFKDDKGNQIDPNLARAVSFGIGTINGGIEVAQIKLLLKTIPGLDKYLSKAIIDTVSSKTVKEKLLTLAGKYAGTVAKETAQEVAQESTNIVFEELAKQINNATKGTGIKPTTVNEVFGRLYDTAVESAQGFAVVALPGTTVKAGLSLKGEKKEGDKKEGKKAGAVTPQETAKPVVNEEYKGKGTTPFIIGVNDNNKGEVQSFTMADPLTGNTFEVPAIEKEDGKDNVKYIPDPDALSAEMERINTEDIDGKIDRLIEGDDSIIEQIYGKEADAPDFEDVTPEEKPAQANAKGEKLYGVESLLNPVEIVENLKGLTNNIKEAMPHLEAIGSQVYQSGKIKFDEWSASMKKTLGDLWESFKDVMRELYSIAIRKLKEERGSISNEDVKAFVETPEGQYTLSLMQQELQAGEAGLMIEEGVYGESGLKSVTGRYFSHMEWAREIMHKHKVDSEYLDNVIQKYLDGKELTEKQFKIFADIRKAANKQNYNIPEEISKFHESESGQKDQDNIAEEFKKVADIAQAERNEKEELKKTLKELRQINNQLKGKVYFSELNKEQLQARYTRLRNNIKWMAQRKETLKNTRDYFGLTDEDMSKISRKNPLLMDEQEFAEYLKEVNLKAIDFKETQFARAQLIRLIEEKRLQKVDNYRQALELPPISKMTTGQLRQFAKLLEPFQNDDIFLTKRELETVDKTILKGIKTWREAKENLVNEINKKRKAKGLDEIGLADLASVSVKWNDSFKWDSSLREQDPFFDLLVTKMTESMIGADLQYHNIETEIYALAEKAQKSRKRSLFDKALPHDDLVFQYLEAPREEKNAVAQQMTPEELQMAHFIHQYFGNYLNYLISIKALERGRQNYITHIRKSFLESVRDDGLNKTLGTDHFWGDLKAQGIRKAVHNVIKEMFARYEEDMMVFNILDDSTGKILPLEKFFQFALHRTGEMQPTKNVVRAFLTYAKMAEKKKAFDAIIPELDIYTQSLTPTKYTPRGLEYDRSLKTFVNKWINNKKGRKISFDSTLRQGGPVDVGIRALRTFTTILDLGLCIPVGIASFVGEQVTNFDMLGAKGQTIGTRRIATDKGKRILEKYESFVGRSFWENFKAPGKELPERLTEGMFGLFHEATRLANKQFLLASMSEEEFNNEELSVERLAEIRLEMGKMRVVPGTNSLVGSTSVGNAAVQYKAWAVPIMRTITHDIGYMVNSLSKKQFGEALSSEECKQLYRLVGLMTVTLIVGSISGDDEDDTFIGKLKSRAYLESTTLLQGLSPSMWLAAPRIMSWLGYMGKAIQDIILLEEYKTKEGLKGVGELKKQITPGFVRQFQNKEK